MSWWAEATSAAVAVGLGVVRWVVGRLGEAGSVEVAVSVALRLAQQAAAEVAAAAAERTETATMLEAEAMAEVQVLQRAANAGAVAGAELVTVLLAGLRAVTMA